MLNTYYFRGEKTTYAAAPDKIPNPNGRPRLFVYKMKWGTIVKFIYKSKVMSVAPGG
jgi:hypothetical protein